MQQRTYRLELDGELGDVAEWAFQGMSVRREQGHTVLVGDIRDQAELQGLLQRIGELGLTLLSVAAVDAGSA